MPSGLWRDWFKQQPERASIISTKDPWIPMEADTHGADSERIYSSLVAKRKNLDDASDSGRVAFCAEVERTLKENDFPIKRSGALHFVAAEALARSSVGRSTRGIERIHVDKGMQFPRAADRPDITSLFLHKITPDHRGSQN